MPLTNPTPELEVQRLFNRLAIHYDAMNTLMTLGTHYYWRRVAMQQLHVQPGNFALDVCCGTGDWTIALAKAVGPRGHVWGLDFSEHMLALARQKVRAAHLEDRVTFIQGDAMQLPYPANTFDVTTIGFGLRNVPDANQVLSELYRVARTGGKAACLETSQPTQPLIKLGWQAYFKLVPVMMSLAGSRYADYDYLQRTTKAFVSAKQLVRMFELAGFAEVRYRTFDLGAAALHLGQKPY